MTTFGFYSPRDLILKLPQGITSFQSVVVSVLCILVILLCAERGLAASPTEELRPVNTEAMTTRQLIDKAHTCLQSDDFDPCKPQGKQTYLSYLRGWKKALIEEKRSSDVSKTGIFDLKTEIDSLDQRIKVVESITPEDCRKLDCESCNDITTCRDRCQNNRRKMGKIRADYKKALQGDEYLNCTTYLKDLDAHLEDLKKTIDSGGLKKGSLESLIKLKQMRRLLYCVSQKDDIDPALAQKVEEIVALAMTMYIVSPPHICDRFIELIEAGILTREDIERIVHTSPKKKNWMDFVMNILETADADTLKLLKESGLLVFFIDMVNQGHVTEQEIETIIKKDNQYKQAWAEFILEAIENADTDTIDMMRKLGLNKTLTKMMVAVYKENPEEFVHFFAKIFFTPANDPQKDPARYKAIRLFVDELFHYGDDIFLRALLQNDKLRKELNRLMNTLPGDLYVRSFIMPGYVRSLSEDSRNPWVSAWNYSNGLILGLSLGSQLLFIDSEYQRTDYYRAGLVGGALFLFNGVLGALEAYRFTHQAESKSGSKPGSGPARVQFVPAYTGDRAMITLRFHF
jgi:hypothetical protein